MKFGKRLKRQMEETLPDWRDKFLRYKDLKRLVRRISAAQPSAPETEAEFVQLLNDEVDKFNAFFVEQEEEFIIRQRELQDRIKRAIHERRLSGAIGDRQLSEADYVTEMGRIRKDVVNLHGEMVLLVNYSSINYTGLAKILKKYDKRTGGLLRLPFIEKVLKQPFYTTDIISKMVKECEITMEAVFPPATDAEEQGNGQEAWASAERLGVFRNAVVALVTMQELRRGSSTYGHFSLPPLSLPDADLPRFFQLPSPISTL